MGDQEAREQDPSQMRVSDADRHRVADLLREAAGEGRLDMDELDQRLEATYAARVYADLAPLTRDLPLGGSEADVVRRPPPAVPTGPAGPAPSTSLALMSGTDRRGVWTVGEAHTAVAVMGGITIDLRQARFAATTVTIRAFAIMGGIDVLVDERTHVVVDGLGVMGAFDQGRDRVAARFDDASPTVRVTGLALMGGVTVTRKAAPSGPEPELGA